MNFIETERGVLSEVFTVMANNAVYVSTGALVGVSLVLASLLL